MCQSRNFFKTVAQNFAELCRYLEYYLYTYVLPRYSDFVNFYENFGPFELISLLLLKTKRLQKDDGWLTG